MIKLLRILFKKVTGLSGYLSANGSEKRRLEKLSKSEQSLAASLKTRIERRKLNENARIKEHFWLTDRERMLEESSGDLRTLLKVQIDLLGADLYEQDPKLKEIPNGDHDTQREREERRIAADVYKQYTGRQLDESARIEEHLLRQRGR